MPATRTAVRAALLTVLGLTVAGDVGYYAPGNDRVLYYGDQSSYPGIVVLGHLDGDAAGRIAGMDGAITATVEVGAG